MSETAVASTQAQPASDGFAPHFVPDDKPVPQRPANNLQAGATAKPQGFASKMVESADKVAHELGVDTSANDIADGKDPNAVPDHDPLGDAEIEIAPGQRRKRSEIARELAAYKTMQAKQKEFERGSHAKMQQAAEVRKQAEAQLAQAQDAIAIRQRLEHLLSSGADEDAILREFGRDPEKYWQSKLEKQYADLQKTPEQRHTEALEARENAIRQREQQYEQQEKQKQEQVRQYQQEQATNNTAQQLSQAFMQAADTHGLPKTALTIQRFANLMASANASNINVTMEQLGSQVRDMYKQETIAMLENLSEDDGFQSLPKTVQDKIRRSMLAKLGQPTASAQAPGQASPKTKQARPMSTAEYNAYISNLRTKGG